MSSKKVIYAIFSSLLLTSPAVAEDSLEQLLVLSVQELGAIQVTTASKRPEKVKEAPGVISVITSDQIKRYGARYLRDILDRQTSFQVTASSTFAYSAGTMRGVLQEGAGNKVLLLLNGRPLRETYRGGINHDIYNYFPVDYIEQIEIIRGPGSVLYGTNAFAGVINIKTKDYREDNKVAVKSRYSSNNDYQQDFSAGYTHGEFNGSFHAGLYRDKDEKYENLVGGFSTSGDLQRKEYAHTVVGEVNYNNFSANVLSIRSDRDTVGASMTFPTARQAFARTFVDLGYKQQFDNNLTTTANITYQNGLLEGDDVLPAGRVAFKTHSLLGDVSIQGAIADKTNFLVGGTYEYLYGSLNADIASIVNTIAPYNSYRAGGFIQLDHQFTDAFSAIAGLQINKPKHVDLDTSVRAGLVYNLNNNWTAKLLYGEAYRSGTPGELFTDVGSLAQGNEELAPEQIATTDLSVAYYNGQYKAALTGYYSEYKDVHKFVGNAYKNEGEIELYGLEFEGTYNLNQNWQLITNINYQDNVNEQDIRGTTYIANWMVKAGLSYANFDEGYSVGVFNSYFGAPTAVRDVEAIPNEGNPSATAYNLLSANASFDLNTLLSLGSGAPRMELDLYAHNLLDEKMYFPNYGTTTINTFPQDTGRSVFVGVKVEF